MSRAAGSVALASAAESTESDYRGLELLRNEFNNIRAPGPTGLSKLKIPLSAANLTIVQGRSGGSRDSPLRSIPGANVHRCYVPGRCDVSLDFTRTCTVPLSVGSDLRHSLLQVLVILNPGLSSAISAL